MLHHWQLGGFGSHNRLISGEESKSPLSLILVNIDMNKISEFCLNANVQKHI